MRNLEIIKLFWPLPLPKKSNFEFPHHTRISSLQFQSMMLFRIYQHFCYNYGAFFIKSEQVCIELSIEKNGVYYTLQKHMEDNAQDIQHDKSSNTPYPYSKQIPHKPPDLPYTRI
ncbi:unnamed protein product [Rhizophagus irregularis]|nr:unnamed protein product [Rhizophagus irregularis]